MARRKQDPFDMAKVKVVKKGNNADCVHHEIISMKDDGNELGVCQRCGQERMYIPAYRREHRRYAETV